MIGINGSISYTELTALKLEPGTLYFHIDVLAKADEPLVEQIENKRYVLTAAGRSAYELIQKGEDGLYWIEQERNPSSTTPLVKVLSISPVIRRIQSDPWRFWLDILLFLGAYGYLSYRVGLIPIFLFFIEGSFDIGITVFAALLAWLSTYLLVELISLPILGKRKFTPAFLMSVPVAFLPFAILELALSFISETVVITGFPLTLILTAAIAWSTYILTHSLARAKVVRPLQAGIVTLLVTNFNLLILALLT